MTHILIGPDSQYSSVRRFFALQVLVWATYGVVHYAASLPAILPEERPEIALVKFIRALSGLILSSAVWPLIRTRVAPDGKRWWLVVAIAAFAAGWAWTFLDRIVLVFTASILRVDVPWERFARGMDLDYFFVMLAWAAAATGFALARYAQRQNEIALERHLAAESSRLQMLASQLNPHFLFNALNTIRSIAAEDADKTREIVARLAGFLRRVLSFDSSEPTTLAEELGLADDYLAVERARFESTLIVTSSIAPETTTLRVPPLILQPLIENAVKHGAADDDGIRRILLKSVREGGSLVITVENRGRLEQPSHQGLGLELTATRLRHMYGGRGRIEIAENAGQVIARITIPIQ